MSSLASAITTRAAGSSRLSSRAPSPLPLQRSMISAPSPVSTNWSRLPTPSPSRAATRASSARTCAREANASDTSLRLPRVARRRRSASEASISSRKGVCSNASMCTSRAWRRNRAITTDAGTVLLRVDALPAPAAVDAERLVSLDVGGASEPTTTGPSVASCQATSAASASCGGCGSTHALPRAQPLPDPKAAASARPQWPPKRWARKPSHSPLQKPLTKGQQSSSEAATPLRVASRSRRGPCVASIKPVVYRWEARAALLGSAAGCSGGAAERSGGLVAVAAARQPPTSPRSERRGCRRAQRRERRSPSIAAETTHPPTKEAARRRGGEVARWGPPHTETST